MKRFLAIKLFTIFVVPLFAQKNFSLESRIVKTGDVVKTYNFTYEYNDSTYLYFTDSTVKFTDPTKKIVKEILYSASDSQPYISVEYLRTNGEDSISKHFSGDKLTKIYETKYDSQNRIIYYGLKDLQADPTYDQSFEWTYEYRDSITNKSKIVIQTIFNTNKKGGKDFHFRVLSEYDNKNRKVKDTRESEPSDPMAQITAYKYDDKDSLIEEKTDGITVDIFNKHVNEPCNKEINRQLKTSDYTSIKNLVKKILSEIKKTINSSNCKTLVYKYNSSDKQIQLIVRKVQPYWEGGRNVSLIKIETF